MRGPLSSMLALSAADLLCALLCAPQASTYVCEYQDYMNYHLTGRMVASISNVSVRWHYNSSRGEPRHALLSNPLCPRHLPRRPLC